MSNTTTDTEDKKQKQTTMISIKIDVDTLAKIDAYAKANGLTRSGFMKFAALQAVKSAS